MGAEAAGAFLGLIFIGFWFMLIFAFIALGALFTAFWIWMLIDAIQREYKNENDRILWIVVIALTGFIGAVIYYFVVKKNKTEQGAKNPKSKEKTKQVKKQSNQSRNKVAVSSQKGSSGKSR